MPTRWSRITALLTHNVRSWSNPEPNSFERSMKSGWDGVLPFGHLPQGSSSGRWRTSPGRRHHRRYSAPDAYCDRLGFRLSQPALGHHYGSWGGFVGFARLVHGQRVSGLPLAARHALSSEGGGSSLRPTLGRWKRDDWPGLPRRCIDATCSAAFPCVPIQVMVKGRYSKHSAGRSGGIVACGWIRGPGASSWASLVVAGSAMACDDCDPLQRAVDKHARCRDQLFGRSAGPSPRTIARSWRAVVGAIRNRTDT